MSKIRWLIPLLFITVSSSCAVSSKEVRTELNSKFEVTKRSLSGEVKRTGTVVYLTIPGVTAERPIFTIKLIRIKDGQIVSDDLSRDTSRVRLSVGEPMHVYSVRTSKNSIRLLLGTEAKYPAHFLVRSKDIHFQTALQFHLDEGAHASVVEAALSEISKALVTEEEAAQLPTLQSAIQEVRKAHELAAEEARKEQWFRRIED